MRGILVSLVLVATLSTITAFDVTFEQHNSREASCKRTGGVFDIHKALDNSTLYEQVFQWMHERDVEHWNYSTEDKYNATTDMRCVLVSYKTLVASPTFFARLLSNFHMSVQFPIVVHKEICTVGRSLVESALVSTPLIHDMSIRGRYEVSEDKIESVIEAQYNLPWYIDFLVYDVSEHLKANLKEKVDAVTQSLCSDASTETKLTSPLHKFSSNLLRRKPPKYPLHAPMKLHPILEPPFHPPFNQKYF
jgi:hypothetical protein